jgi:EpsG family
LWARPEEWRLHVSSLAEGNGDMTTLRGDADCGSGPGNQVATEQRPIPDHFDHGIAISLFLLVSWILASRQLYTAPDDVSYLAHFDGHLSIDSNSSWWEFLIEEPLWALWTATTGYSLGSEMAMRVTIFLSSFGLLWSANRLSKGAWVFVLLVFILSEPLASQLYFNQIRQGVALTLCLAGLAVGTRSGFVLTGVATTIHTSFFFVLLAMSLAALTKRFSNRHLVAFSIATVVAMVSLKAYVNLDSVVDILGRRGRGYAMESSANLNSYAVSLLVFAVVMYSVRRFERTDYLLWRLTLFLYGLTFIGSFYHEASGRLFYLLSILYPILIARSSLKKPPAYALFVIFIVTSAVWSHLRYTEYSVLDRWELILYGSR